MKKLVLSLSVLLAGLLTVGLMVYLSLLRPLRFSLEYQDAHGIGEESPLFYHGVEIGSVDGVEVHPGGTVALHVVVPHEHREIVYREARYEIERGSETVYLEMSDTSGRRTPVEPGDVIEGYDGLMAETLESMRGAGSQGLELVRGALAKAFDKKDDEERFFESVEEYESAPDPSLLRQIDRDARRVRQRLETSHPRRAEQFWESYERWRSEATSSTQ